MKDFVQNANNKDMIKDNVKS